MKTPVICLLYHTSLISCFGKAIYIMFRIAVSHLILTIGRKLAPVSLDGLWKDANLFLYVRFQAYSWRAAVLFYAIFRVLVSGKFRDIINHMGVLQLNNFLSFWWSQLLQISPSFIFRTGSLWLARFTSANPTCQLMLEHLGRNLEIWDFHESKLHLGSFQKIKPLHFILQGHGLWDLL